MGVETDPELVAAAVAGDRSSLERLLLAHSERLCKRIAGKLPVRLRSVVSEEDVLQQTFIDAFRGIARFEPREGTAFYHWLAAIADNRLRDAVKAQTTAKRGGEAEIQGSNALLVDLIEDLVATLARTPSQSAAAHEAEQAIRVGLASLKDDYRRVIELRYVQGLPVAETAERLQKTPDAVRNLCRRGLAELHAVLGQSSRFLSRR